MEMTREAFLAQAITGAAALALIGEESLTKTAEAQGDFIAISGFRDGQHYGLAFKLTGDADQDLQATKWLRRSIELWYNGEAV